ncbi:5434_t:CDS:10 [Funneliformis geosporum]|uniref:17501_t:CDS:1 n=1 Tax=Funneliformis geosporum TaxID=1117311 RepID=A0A9W4SMU2_9GLOM|nr:17501_t:CDS:10 [Funneliformis geosporum]CAI2175336.1 5434_t:CDS:10 [Funneliformis geosporum]
MNSLQKIIIILFLISILILCLPIHQSKAEFVYTESDPELEVVKLETYKDKSIIIRVVKQLETGCREPALRLRIIYENGTVTPLYISQQELDIPEWNFCRVEMGYHRIKGSYALRLYSWIPNYLIITYMNGTSYTDQENMSVFVKLITWSGEVIGDQYVGPAYIVNGIIQYPIETHFDRVQPERGFFYADFLSGTNFIYWVHFSAPNEYGIITRLKAGTIELENMLYGSFFYTIPTLGGGDFGIVVVNSTISYDIPVDGNLDPLHKQLQTYAIFISQNTYEQRGPYLLHNFGATPALSLRELACGIDYYELNYNCFLVVRTNLTERSHFLTKITFTVDGSKTVDQTYENNEINSLNVHEIYMESLHYGGYLLILHRYNELNETFEDLYGYMFDREAKLRGPWPFGNPLAKPALGRRYGILKNNTLTAINQKPSDPIWSIESKSLTNFIEFVSYKNPNIISTDPLNNDPKIPLRKASITIFFKNEIALSNGNITIFQYQGSEKVLKQSHSGLHPNCILGDDHKSVTIKMLDSNFNIPNGTYTVELSHEFFVDKLTRLAPLGLQAGDWNFTTEFKLDEYRDSVDVVLGLTEDASTYFKNLTLEDKASFLNQMSIDLTKTIPTEPTRFIPIQETQNHDNANKLLISIKIRQRDDPFKLNGMMIIRDLNTLIKNKEITGISRFESTNMLDEEFGSVIRKSVSGNYKVEVSLLAAFFGIILLLNFYACCSKLEQQNSIFVAIKISLATLDFIFDVWFIATYIDAKAATSAGSLDKTIFTTLGLFIDTESFKLIKDWNAITSNVDQRSYWSKYVFQDIPQLIIQYNALIVISITLNSLLIFHSTVIRKIMTQL